MRYHIWTFGCQMNVADSQKLAAGLERLGMRAASNPEQADLVVVNTCSVRQHAEERAFGRLGMLRRLKRSRPRMKIAVMGCLVGPRADDLRRRFSFVDLFARPQEYDPILEAVGYCREELGGEFWPHTFGLAGGPTAYVPVIHGCDKFCAYCVVPYRRGREQSRPIAEIVEEVEHLVLGGKDGVREVTLLGQTVEAYGRDLADRPDLSDLVRAIHDIPGLERIRFLTSYPRDMTERIVDAAAELPKVCEHFNLPVQSGDDAVLLRMRRGYTVAEYRKKLDMLRRRIPYCSVTTDVIVGFCGETEEAFRRTYDLLAELRFDKVHVAAYSPRPGTIAWRKMEDDVPQPAKMERLHAVEELQTRIAAEINSKLLGQTVEVLAEERVEGKASALRAAGRMLTGRTRSGKLVRFVGHARPGDLVDVAVEHTGPWSLRGRQVGDELLALSPVEANLIAAR